MQKENFLSLFICSFVFLVASYFSGQFPVFYLAAFLLIPAFAAFHFFGRAPALTFLVFSIVYLLLFSVQHISTLYLHMGFLSFSLYFLWPQRKPLIEGCGPPLTRIGWGAAIFLSMLAVSFIVNILMYFTGYADQAQILDVVSGLPLYLLVMAFTLGPLSEELFFRAFLVPRAGVLASALLFMFTHVAYGSASELAGALALGLVLGIAYKYLKDPVPCIVAHFLFNLLSVIMILWVY
ncbi:CPBP family intramembrane metalloprotease [Candidatus Micrarchaeota archaeon]|nr:CPBP family intramembrane metalloprotease [Candidatus Micrarchaeota archaeon]MBD3417468.1 CPBP family intramembrane metalloprotease [Candidatus Micrarchaeota archaeon]